jgi:hypothetical protein
MPSPQEPEPKRAPTGEAAYKKALEAIAQRNARAQKSAREQRLAFERQKADLRAQDERR